MIHTDEDDEFERIEHEAKMRSGQPYHWDVYVSPSQRNQVLEEMAKVFDARDKGTGFYDPHEPAEIIRAMKGQL
jgi:hypothetical protein